ncbi:hypothetical protein BSG1_19125 [Bacillus sp. SG-1]|nr:hypothetical protein BSG1_19125 [Bacillus sp. SG-1]
MRMERMEYGGGIQKPARHRLPLDPLI